MRTAQVPTCTFVIEQVQRIKECLAESDIRPESGLVSGLGLDSLDIAALAGRICDELGPVDLLPWLMSTASGDGTGTVGELAAYLDSMRAATAAGPR